MVAFLSSWSEESIYFWRKKFRSVTEEVETSIENFLEDEKIFVNGFDIPVITIVIKKVPAGKNEFIFVDVAINCLFLMLEI